MTRQNLNAYIRQHLRDPEPLINALLNYEPLTLSVQGKEVGFTYTDVAVVEGYLVPDEATYWFEADSEQSAWQIKGMYDELPAT
jgi:hypothetical protein